MITKKRVTQILCIIDESDKNLNAELDKNLRLPYNGGYIVLPYKPNISLIHSILYNKLFAYICNFLYLYIIILADIYA